MLNAPWDIPLRSACKLFLVKNYKTVQHSIFITRLTYNIKDDGTVGKFHTSNILCNSKFLLVNVLYSFLTNTYLQSLELIF